MESINLHEICEVFKVDIAEARQWRARGMPCKQVSANTVRYDLLDVVDWLDMNKVTYNDAERV